MRDTLTQREIDILQWVLAGKTDWEIATILHLSRKTVNFHIERAKRKLGQSSRITAIAIALRDGLVFFPGLAPARS
jgi:DNA-binding CsgD family transcriptional regulator